jgi:lysophospholipase L1-like esterase
MLLAAFLSVAAAFGQLVTTTVTESLYQANGLPASGTVLITWPAFTTPAGISVPSGSTSVTVAADGTLSVQLAPNAGATPIGTYYTAIYHLDDGTVSREYWVVPQSSTPVQVSAIKSTVLPATVAMQTVSKSYVDTAIAAAVTGHPLDESNPYVLKQGDTMTGPLILPGDPTTSLEAVDKQYVDQNITALTTGVGQKVSMLPSATQVVAQPAGTDLKTNKLNGDLYASQYQTTDRGQNGIAQAAQSADCASGCSIKAEQSYTAPENYLPTDWNAQTHLEDLRRGQRYDSYLDPESVLHPGIESGQVIDVTSTQSGAAVRQATGNQTPESTALRIEHKALAGGSNEFPQGFSGIPYFKSNYTALSVNGTYNTQGQHVLAPMATYCYGVGDCLIGAQFLFASGGLRDNADEGTHPFDLQVQEDSRVFQGTCTSGCTTGSTSVAITATANAGTQGDGRFLIDTNPAKVITSGTLIGTANRVNPGALFSGTSFPLSTFFQTSAAIPAQTQDIAPGTVTIAIATTGVPTGYTTNTAAATAQSGVACIADNGNTSNGIMNFEMASYTVVDGTHLQLTLHKAHAGQATVAVGGLCGYGLEQTVDTTNGIRQVFPVIGSYSPTALEYAGSQTPIVGLQGFTSGYRNINMQIASIARTSNVVTITTAGNFPVDIGGLSMTVAGVADSSYNGTFAVTTTGGNTLTYAQNGPDSTSSGGALTMLTGGYALYPMAEVLSVMNPANKRVDGQMTLAANNVPWSANDTVEEPHYFQEKVYGDTEFITQYTPRPLNYAGAGMQYQGNNGPGLQGWTVANSTPLSYYMGNGGTHSVPDFAYQSKGAWKRVMSVDAGEQAVFAVHCNLHGCNKWNSAYNLFELDSSVSADTISYTPTTSALTFAMRGSVFTLTPQGFTAPVVNAATINATTINGSVAASQLPVFHGSGSAHAQGVVPDPGATAGTSRYLREDGTWAVPAGGVTGSGGTSLSTGTALVPGATADYSFMDGTGTTLTDSTPNGNNGTLSSGANAPVWTRNGLAFSATQGVSLPSALNGTQTFFAAVYINPLTGGQQIHEQYPVLVTSSNGLTGVNLMISLKLGATFYPLAYAPSILANGAVTTTATNVMSGFHVLAYVLGTGAGSVDHFYVDGVEVGSYSAQGASANSQSSGNLYLGSSNAGPWSQGGFNGTMYRFRTYPSALSAADVQTVSQAIRADAASRGVPVTPAPQPVSTPQLHAIGDSITFGEGGVTPWPSLLSLTNQPAYAVQNWGISSITLIDILGSESNRAALSCASTTGPSIAIILAGTNDFLFGSPTPQSVFASMTGEIQVLKRAGCKVFAATMLSRGGTDINGTSYDADKNAYDALILTQAKAVGADGVIDFAANPLLGADGANTNTYFQADHIHPSQTGQALLGSIASNVLNYYFGASAMNPHVVTSLPYSMTAADGEVSLNGVTSAGALTLPDCAGQSGATYRINNPQTAYAITVTGLNANQPINGLTTPVTVPANGTLVLHDVPNPKTVSGCHWEM